MSALASAISAEWVKVRSIRSTYWILVGFGAVAIGLGTLAAGGFTGATEDFEPFPPIFFSLMTAQLLLISFAITAVGGEYQTGTIRSSLAAVPRRGRFYAAKMTVIGLTVAAAALAVELATFAAVSFRFGFIASPLDEWATIETMVGGWIHLTLLSLFAAGIAAMLRSSVLTLSVLLPVLFLSSQGLGNLKPIKPVAQYLPDQVGMVIMRMTVPGDPTFGRDYGPWTGIGILLLWTSASLVVGWIVMRRRDA